MSTLSRSKGFSNGRFTDQGNSAVGLQNEINEQIYSQMNTHRNFENWNRLHNEQNSLAGRYQLYRNSTLDNPPMSFNDFKSSKAMENFDRLKNAGKRHRPSRKYKKSAKRVFRKKSRATRRR
jgi:hypothetical protein